MTTMQKLLEMKGDNEFLPVPGKENDIVIEGINEYKGRKYLITFIIFGTRCGYVELTESDVTFLSNKSINGTHIEDILSCEGGITFFGKSHLLKNSNDYWVGFDPEIPYEGRCEQTINKYFPPTQETIRAVHFAISWNKMTNKVPKSYQYMAKECEQLIDQLIALEINQSEQM